MKIIFIGERPVSSAPTLTWAKALSKIGVDYEFIDFSETSTIAWVKKALKADAIICQWYGTVNEYAMRQLAIASFLGCPIVRKWSGSDIYYALNDTSIRKSTHEFDKLVTLNLTSEHSGIINELNSIGLTGILTDQVINDIPQIPTSTFSKAVLAYLPNDRYEFYGYSYIEKLVIKYPDTEFVVIADKEHRLANYKNVTSLGWVDDMAPVWDKVGLLIRITEHDGFARSIVEAMAQNKYVIHNRQYDGCWYAKTQEEIEQQLERFIAAEGINLEAKPFIKKIISNDSVTQLYSLLSKLRCSFSKRFIAFIYIIKKTIASRH